MKSGHVRPLLSVVLPIAIGCLLLVPVITSANGYVAGFVFFPLFLLALIVAAGLFVVGVIATGMKGRSGIWLLVTGPALLVGFFGFAIVAKQFQLGAYREEPMVSLVPEVSNVVLFKKGITHEERKFFEENVVATPRGDGRGYEHLPGVQMTASLPSYQGHEAYEFNFFPTATEEQKRLVYERIRSSAIVEELRENVATRDYRLSEASNSEADNRSTR